MCEVLRSSGSPRPQRSPKIMKAVILAGGEGTRLRPLTLSIPKPAAPVVDRPFLRHQLDLLAGAGVSEVIFSVAYHPERVEAVFGDGIGFGLRIRYAVESTPLGTGGAVKNAEPLLDERTIVLNGDILADLDLASVVARHEAGGASATIVLTPLLALLSTLVAVTASSRTQDPRAAQAWGVAIVFPMLGLAGSLFAGVVIDMKVMGVIVAVVGLACLLMYRVAIWLFQREVILTRWK